MDLILFAIVILQFLYMIYSDIQNRKERESLELKLMSKNTEEYKYLLEDTPEESKKEDPDPYISMDEAGIEKVLKAKEE
jgi:hypothetical protein